MTAEFFRRGSAFRQISDFRTHASSARNNADAAAACSESLRPVSPARSWPPHLLQLLRPRLVGGAPTGSQV